MVESWARNLRAMKICRFCLTEEAGDNLTSIFQRQIKEAKQAVPLPLQLMACVAIEVFENDGMPQLICQTCRTQTLQAYTFKTNCKKADDALKVYLATGTLTKPFTREETSEASISSEASKRATTSKPEHRPKKMKVEILQEPEPIEEELSVLEEQYKIAEDEDSMEHIHEEEDEDWEPDDAEEHVNRTLTVNQVETDCFSCTECHRSFPLKQLLDLHMANHNRARNFNCSECDKAFFTKYDLTKHVLTHNGNKPYTCVVCCKTFARESILHRHEKIHIDVPKYLCTLCDRTFLTGDDLDVHVSKHKKNRPYVCKICNKSFVFKQGLERHESTHTNVKPHRCNYCEASFTSPIKLTRHVTSHAGLRPYPCKLCGRTFLLSHHLTRHMRSHYASQQPHEVYLPSSIGKYKCDICSMSFRRRDSLINHSAIHSMVNLKCVICNTEFDNVERVREHITTHLSDLPFPCEKCDYSFETQDQLEDHELKHAEMEYEEQIEQEVLAEARSAATTKEEVEDNNSEISGDDIAEYTITNDMMNPELVRRSRRSSKVHNYAEMLGDGEGSDGEAEQPDAEEQEEQEEPEDEEGATPQVEMAQEEDVIKPIVRTEGTKVYGRKSFPQRQRVLLQMSMPKTSKTDLLDCGSSLTHDLNKMPDKEIFNMRIGDKTVTVQKLVLTKEQMLAMAKEGKKIEKQGNTLLLTKGRNSLGNLNIGKIFDMATNSENKTNAKKTFAAVRDESVTDLVNSFNDSSDEDK